MMTKRQKVWLWVLAGVVLLIGVGFVCSDAIISHMVNKKVKEALQAEERFSISYKYIAVMMGSRTVELRGLDFSTAPAEIKDAAEEAAAEYKPAVHVYVDRVSVRLISLLDLIRDRQVNIHQIVIDEPEVTLRLPLDQKALNSKDKKQAATADTVKANIPIKSIAVGKIKVKDGSLRLSDAKSKLDVSLDDLRLVANDLGYDIQKGEFTYNDSLYQFSLEDLSFTTPDGLMHIDLKSLDTKDAKEVTLTNLHCFNTVEKLQLADIKGKVPSTWIDVTLKKIQTSPVNIIRQAMNKEISIDRVSVEGSKGLAFRDVRYPPKYPSGMPQEAMLKMPIPLRIKKVNMSMPEFDVELSTLNINRGLLVVKNVSGTLTNVTNKKGEKLHAKVHAALSHGGEGNVNLMLKMDKASHFEFEAKFKDVQGESFNQFLHPLFGAEAYFTIDSLTTHYTGDNKRADGDFCMVYKDIQVHIIKEDAPYNLIAKNAETINILAPAVLQRHNPRIIGQKPQSYAVSKERDVLEEFPIYLIGPMLDGVLKTLLPGFIVRTIDKQTSKKAAEHAEQFGQKKQKPAQKPLMQTTKKAK